MKSTLKISIILIFSIFAVNISAQENSDSTATSSYSTKKPYYIVLKDGSSYTGFIVKDDAREILIKTTNVGEIYIPKVSIKSITEIDDIGKMKQGKYFGEEIYYTRYLMTANALSLERGDANASVMFYGLFVQSQYGITDQLDLGVGTSWLGNPLTLTLKYSMDINSDLTFAIGGVGITTTYTQGDYAGGGFGYGVLTKGSASTNISVGAGYGGFNVFGDVIQGPMFTLGAYKRLRPRLAILLDGLYFPETTIYFGGPGIRYFRKRKEGEMIDFGLMVIGSPFTNNGIPIGPIPTFSYIITL